MTARFGAQHRLDIYGVELHLVWTGTQVENLRRRFDGQPWDLDPDMAGTTSRVIEYHDQLETEHVIVYVNVDRLGDDQVLRVDTVAHEATHAAGYIMDAHGVTQDCRQEHVAYLIGWLAAWVWQNLPT